MTPAAICSAVAVSLALEELDHLKAMERLPDPETLLEHLRLRNCDFDILAGVAGAYLHERGLIGGCE
jgi:hypothetical protein